MLDIKGSFNEEDLKKAAVPFAALDIALFRLERANRRLIMVIVLLITLLFGTNAAWIWYEAQWEVVEETTVTQDVDATDGGNATINDGVRIYGESNPNGD